MLKGKSLILKHLRPLFFSAFIACLITVSLGFVSGLIGSLIGPAIKIVTISNTTKYIALDELFGEQISKYISHFYDQPQISVQNIWDFLPALIIAVAFIKAVLIISQWFLWERIGEKISMSVRSELMHNYIRIDPSLRAIESFREKDSQVASMMTNDVKLLREFIIRFYGGIPREGFQIIFYIFVLVSLSPKLFLYFFCGVLPTIVVASRLGKKISKRTSDALEDFSGLSEWLQQRLMGIETIKHYRSESHELGRMKGLNTELFDKFVKSARVKTRTAPILELISVTVMTAVIGFAIFAVRHGEASGSVMMSFLATLGLFSQSAGHIGKYYSSAKEGSAASNRISSMLDWMKNLCKPINRDFSLESNTVLLKSNRVSYKYPDASEYALVDFNYEFKKGKVYCLKGASGCGKSTLFKIFLGVMSPTQGEVLYNRALKNEEIGYLPQNLELLSATVAENISYPNPEFDHQRIMLVLAEVGLLDLFQSCEDGIKTKVGDGGRELSGGQIQRIFLARILYHDFKVVFMDEATSALDPETEQKILSLMDNLKSRGALIIKIAHRASSISRADEVLNMEIFGH